ncbi:MAG: PQQ-binding-like beta-propeller repeat protein [Ardenticatenaceae bacterium]|nr:PQQ-binding-like beta-propeller repeat protein [Ardenticatenaceae bacterium]MCB9443173.1 PQQ-binding-like beta-propeller repeat protein [Ardenticatenaceae bacterium]
MTAPNTIWTAELDQTISQPSLVFSDTLLLATQPSGPVVQHSGLLALDLATGQTRWQHAFEYALVSGMQAYHLMAEGREIAVVATSSSDFLNGQGGLLAFDEAGTIFWQGEVEEQHFSAPVVKDRQLFVVAGGKNLLIISPETGGDDQHRIPLSAAASQAAPVIADGVAYIPCRSPDLLAVALDGNERWHFQFQGSKRDWLDQTPIVIGAFVYAVSSQGSVFALERETGQMVWQATVGAQRPLSAPTLHNDTLYVGFAEGMAALDRRNGRIQWTFPTSRPISAQPLIIHDTVYCTSEDHHLYALDLVSGVERWRYELPRRIETPPVLAKSALLVVDRGGNGVAWERPFVPETTSDPAAADTAATTAAAKVAPAILEQKAKVHEAAGEPLAAAAVWYELGQLERAAQQYELGGSWLEAAKLWQQIDRYGKRAEAFEQYARQLLGNGQIGDEEKALAWEQAARAYAETGQKEERQRCEQETARFRRQPVLTVEVEPEGPMEMDAWARVNYTVRNEGFGVARGLQVSIKDDRFEGQSARTQTIITLQPGREYQHWLDVSPKAHGSSVPMQLLIEYIDKSNGVHKLERIFYLEVAEGDELPATAPLTPPSISTGSLEILSTIKAPDGRDLFALRNQIVQSFNKDEMIDVLFQMNLREDDFDERLSSMVRELMVYVVQNGRFAELLAICQERRPALEW